MLGKVAFELPLAADGSGLDDSAVRNVFTTGGKTPRYANGGRAAEPENTTINAIFVVELFPLGQNRFSQHFDDLDWPRSESESGDAREKIELRISP